MTKRSPTQPGAYKTELGKELAGMTVADTIADIRPGKPEPKSVEDWLRADHQRNAFNRDIEEIKRNTHSTNFWVRIGISLLALILMMQLVIRFWG